MSARTRRVPAVHASRRIDDAVAFRVHRTNRLLLTHLARFLTAEGHGLSPEQWFLLGRLAQTGPVPQVDLTDPTLGDAPNVSRLLDALAAAGLVDRRRNPDDRRSQLVGLTSAGASSVEALLDSAVEERARVFAGLSATDLRGFVAVLDRVDANLAALLEDGIPTP